MSKFSKRPNDTNQIPLRVARKKVAAIIANLRQEGQSKSDLFKRARHWIDVQSKSHWKAMGRGEDVSELINEIRSTAGEIIWDYNTRK